MPLTLSGRQQQSPRCSPSASRSESTFRDSSGQTLVFEFGRGTGQRRHSFSHIAAYVRARLSRNNSRRNRPLGSPPVSHLQPEVEKRCVAHPDSAGGPHVTKTTFNSIRRKLSKRILDPPGTVIVKHELRRLPSLDKVLEMDKELLVSVKTCEAAAAAKIFLETRHNSLMSPINARQARGDVLEQRLLTLRRPAFIKHRIRLA